MPDCKRPAYVEVTPTVGILFIIILNKMTSIKNEAGNSLPQAFIYNASNQQVRTVIVNGEPFFVAKDVCDILQLSDVCKTVSKLDDDEKLIRKVFVSGQNRDVTLVNESGLYNLIFRSYKSEAKTFRKWVTGEVLPTLRKTGKYEVKPRQSVRYPRRGEQMTADVLDLLWLIGESLHQGDIKDIALELGMSRGQVHRVLNGESRSSKVLMALYRRARANRAEDALYVNPALAAERLRNDEDCLMISENNLPAVSCGKGSGAVLGNTNARKNGGQ